MIPKPLNLNSHSQLFLSMNNNHNEYFILHYSTGLLDYFCLVGIKQVIESKTTLANPVIFHTIISFDPQLKEFEFRT